MSEKIPTPSELEGKMQNEMSASAEKHNKDRKRKMESIDSAIENPFKNPIDEFAEQNISFELPKKKKKNQVESDYIFRMMGEFKKDEYGRNIYPKLTIDNMDQVLDPDSGKLRTIRLLKGVDTIWMDEQEHITEKQAESMRPSLVFHEGQLRVPAYERNTIEFLKRKNACSNNEFRMRGSKTWYYLEDYMKREKEEYEREKIKTEAENLAMNASDDQMIAHGRFLGILMVNDAGEMMSPFGIRVKYKKEAQMNPEAFMNSFHNPHLKMHFVISEKVESGEIIIDRAALKAKWNNGATICILPEAKDPIKHLAEFCFTENGKYFKSILQEEYEKGL